MNSLRFTLYFLSCLILIGLSACKPNPKNVQTAYKATKPYADDVIKWTSRVLSKRYSQQKLVQVSKMVVSRGKSSNIVGPNGATLFKLNGQTYYRLNGGKVARADDFTYLQQTFDDTYQNIARKILENIDSYKVYPDEIEHLIGKSLNDMAGALDELTKVTYEKETNQLLIEFKIYQRIYDLNALFTDAGLTGVGATIGAGGYYIIKE